MPEAPRGLPDLQTFILPSRAYLLSFRDQTLPARRFALADARKYFDHCDAEDHEAQVALLGLMGDALQVVEDVGVLANALMTGIPGLSFYVKATAYDPSNVNDFYAQAHKRNEDYYLSVAALKFAGTCAHEMFRFDPPLEDADREAMAAAECATGRLVGDHIMWLAEAWEAHRHFFRAYKHGALVANPEDVHLMEDGKEVVATVAAWRRRRPQAELGSHADFPLADLARYATLVGEVALDTLDYIVDTRLSVFDRIRFTEGGTVETIERGGAPWRLWFRSGDIDESRVRHLEERFGIRFEQRSVALQSRAD